ncbi:MAG TPA: YacL family protein [Thermoanaerobaculia bacterium]|nr:YacL family protein [Thermoanaerobaculia bacterium]
MQLQFYWDSEGTPRAQCDPPGSTVADFLESDVQGSLELAHEILRALDRIDAGTIDSWEVTGNAHTLTLSKQGVAIQSEVDEDAGPMLLAKSQFREVMAGWVSFVGRTRTSTD